MIMHDKEIFDIATKITELVHEDMDIYAILKLPRKLSFRVGEEYK